jgi:hypothetical protein
VHAVPRKTGARRAYDRVETEPGVHTLHADPAGEACLVLCAWPCCPVRVLHNPFLTCLASGSAVPPYMCKA